MGIFANVGQGCNIFLGTTNQNVENVPSDHKKYHVTIKHTKWLYAKYSKWTQNIPTFSITRPYKIYPNSDCWFENMTSGKCR
jgi:hypothetical protein